MTLDTELFSSECCAAGKKSPCKQMTDHSEIKTMMQKGETAIAVSPFMSGQGK
ncbi:hypothetical protein GT642_09505 [Butyricicoccus sp. BIOML-A1]|nr:hypothetical protein [Butyricicoccus sp. BIOML-A1]